jgi:hypothetical protein
MKKNKQDFFEQASVSAGEENCDEYVDNALETLSAISSYVGSGLGDENTTPSEYYERILEGIDNLVSIARDMPPEVIVAHERREFDVIKQRLIRRIEKKDKRIAGLESKVQQLEEALAWRNIDLENLTKNIRHEVQEAVSNMRMIPMNGMARDRFVEIRTYPAS